MTDQTTADLAHWTEYLERDGGSVPCSRYGRNSIDCAPWAIACHLIYIEANGPGDLSDEDALNYYMGLVVNDHDDVEYLIREYGYVLPESLAYLVDKTLTRPNNEQTRRQTSDRPTHHPNQQPPTRHPRRLGTDGEEREEFDYIDWPAIEDGTDSASFFRYSGVTYDLGDFQTIHRDWGMMRDSSAPIDHPFLAWDGYISDSFFSGILIRYVPTATTNRSLSPPTTHNREQTRRTDQ